MLHTPGCQPLHVFKLSCPVNDGFCAQPVHPAHGRGFLLEFSSVVDPDIRRIRMILGLLDPTCTDPEPYIIKQKKYDKPRFLLFCDFFMTLFLRKWCKCTFKKYRNKQKNFSDGSAALLMIRWIRIRTGMQKSQKLCLKSVDALALNLSWIFEILYADPVVIHAKYNN